MTLCNICLRTDRRTLAGSKQIVRFYAEITNNRISIPTYFCVECDYLLKKFFKFKEKCKQASETLANWESGAISEQSENLHKFVPPSPIGFWSVKANSLVCVIAYEEVTFKEEPFVIEENDALADTTIEVATPKVEEDNFYSESVNQENDSETHIKTEIDDDDNYENVESKNDDSNFEPEETKKDTEIEKEVKKEKKKPLFKLKQPFPAKYKKRLVEVCTLRNKQYESLFDIKYLTTTKLMLEEFEQRKTYEAYIKAEHKCNICYNTFNNQKSVDLHKNTYHNENNTAGREKCQICSMWVLNLHRKHKGVHSFVYKCKLCPLVTYYRSSMVHHYEQHMGTKYHCEQCTSVFKSASALANHKSRHVNSDAKNVSYLCRTCGRGFYTQSGLFIHSTKSVACRKNRERAEQSLTKDSVRCDKCDVSFASEKAHRVHVLQIHKTRRPNRCNMHCQSCNIKFHRKLEYHKHLTEIHNVTQDTEKQTRKKRDKNFEVKPRKHTRVRPYNPPKFTCRLCNTKGEGFGWLHRHFKKEHPNESQEAVYADLKTHLCEQCGAGFTRDYMLRYHLVQHEQQRPFECDVCSKRFRSLAQARIHRRKNHQDCD